MLRGLYILGVLICVIFICRQNNLARKITIVVLCYYASSLIFYLLLLASYGQLTSLPINSLISYPMSIVLSILCLVYFLNRKTKDAFENINNNKIQP
jgi:amino acid permease